MLQRQVSKVTGLAPFKRSGDPMPFQRRIIKRLNILNLKSIHFEVDLIFKLFACIMHKNAKIIPESHIEISFTFAFEINR